MTEPLTLTVEGREYTLDPDEVVAGWTTERALWWADLLARAERELLTADARLRQWRAAAVDAEATAHPKRAEWRVRAAVESTPEWLALRATVADATHAATLLRHLLLLASSRTSPAP